MGLAWLVVVVGEMIYCKGFRCNIQMKSRSEDPSLEGRIILKYMWIIWNLLGWKLVHV